MVSVAIRPVFCAGVFLPLIFVYYELFSHTDTEGLRLSKCFLCFST